MVKHKRTQDPFTAGLQSLMNNPDLNPNNPAFLQMKSASGLSLYDMVTYAGKKKPTQKQIDDQKSQARLKQLQQ
jgi:hypothetical protein